MSDKPLPHLFIEEISEKTLPSFEEFESEILKDGALSRRNKLLIAVASAVAVNCEFCVQELSRKALNEGVKLEELVEAASVACLICGGSAFRRASLILNLVVDKSGDKG
ncbi:MAG: carboxymuconolactone decarboxylase family protein [Candidatus Bathyarchaeia archaeon]